MQVLDLVARRRRRVPQFLVDGGARDLAPVQRQRHRLGDPLVISWEGFEDAESGVTSVEWAVGLTPGGTELRNFTDVGAASGSVPRSWTPPDTAGLREGQAVFSTLRATNGAGAQTYVRADGVRLVAPTCSTTPLLCLPLPPNSSLDGDSAASAGVVPHPV